MRTSSIRPDQKVPGFIFLSAPMYKPLPELGRALCVSSAATTPSTSEHPARTIPDKTYAMPLPVGGDGFGLQRTAVPAGTFKLGHQLALGIGYESIGARRLRDNHLAGRAAFDPGENTERPFCRVQHERGADTVVHTIELECPTNPPAGRLPGRTTHDRRVVLVGAIRSDEAFRLVQFVVRYPCRITHFREQMLGKDNQVLDIYYAITPGIASKSRRPMLLVSHRIWSSSR